MPPRKKAAVKVDEERAPRSEAERVAQQTEEYRAPEVVTLRCEHRFGTYPYTNDVFVIVNDPETGMPTKVPKQEGKQIKADEYMAYVSETEIPAILAAGLIKPTGAGPVWFEDDTRARQHGMTPLGIVNSGMVGTSIPQQALPPVPTWDTLETDDAASLVEVGKVKADEAMQWEVANLKRPEIIQMLAGALSAADEVEGELAAEVG